MTILAQSRTDHLKAPISHNLRQLCLILYSICHVCLRIYFIIEIGLILYDSLISRLPKDGVKVLTIRHCCLLCLCWRSNLRHWFTINLSHQPSITRSNASWLLPWGCTASFIQKGPISFWLIKYLLLLFLFFYWIFTFCAWLLTTVITVYFTSVLLFRDFVIQLFNELRGLY